MTEHQWWCGGKDPCACTEAWKEETWPNDLIAFKWAETLSTGEQSVLLASSLKYLQARIDAALTKAIADERAKLREVAQEALVIVELHGPMMFHVGNQTKYAELAARLRAAPGENR
jgi:hypothetical protein